LFTRQPGVCTRPLTLPALPRGGRRDGSGLQPVPFPSPASIPSGMKIDRLTPLSSRSASIAVPPTPGGISSKEWHKNFKMMRQVPQPSPAMVHGAGSSGSTPKSDDRQQCFPLLPRCFQRTHSVPVRPARVAHTPSLHLLPPPTRRESLILATLFPNRISPSSSSSSSSPFPCSRSPPHAEAPRQGCPSSAARAGHKETAHIPHHDWQLLRLCLSIPATSFNPDSPRQR